jgi:hypothetical protein
MFSVEMDIDPNPPKYCNDGDVEMSLVPPEPDWKSEIKKIIDKINKKLNFDDYVISIRAQRNPKAVKLKSEPVSILYIHRDLKSITKDKELNTQTKLMKPNTNSELNDDGKARNYLKSLLVDLGKKFNIFKKPENLDETEKQKMIYAMHLLADMDEATSRSYLEMNQWNFQEAAVLHLMKNYCNQ